MGQIEVARSYLMQHRGKEEEIILTNERNFEIGIAQLFELKCGVQTAKATTENEDTVFFHRRLILCSEFSLAGRLICMTRHEVCRIRELNLTNLSVLVTEICEQAEIFPHRPRLGWRAWPCARGLCIRDLRDVLKAENQNLG